MSRAVFTAVPGESTHFYETLFASGPLLLIGCVLMLLTVAFFLLRYLRKSYAVEEPSLSDLLMYVASSKAPVRELPRCYPCARMANIMKQRNEKGGKRKLKKGSKTIGGSNQDVQIVLEGQLKASPPSQRKATPKNNASVSTTATASVTIPRQSPTSIRKEKVLRARSHSASPGSCLQHRITSNSNPSSRSSRSSSIKANDKAKNEDQLKEEDSTPSVECAPSSDPGPQSCAEDFALDEATINFMKQLGWDPQESEQESALTEQEISSFTRKYATLLSTNSTTTNESVISDTVPSVSKS
jgi:hypothetical protein